MDMEGLPNSKLKLPQNVLGAGEVITADNFSVLVPLKSNESSRQFKDVTFGTYLDTVSPMATIKIEFGKGSVQKSVGCSCDEDSTTIINKLIDYLVAALKGDESSRPNREGAAREFCGCLKDGKFNELKTGVYKIDVTTLEEKGLDVDNTPRGFLNKGPYRIPDFGEKSCRCIGSGSLQETIKEHISKAIKQKKTILKEERVVKTILTQLRKIGK